MNSSEDSRQSTLDALLKLKVAWRRLGEEYADVRRQACEIEGVEYGERCGECPWCAVAAALATLEEVHADERAAILDWWEARRPFRWTKERHKHQPLVNCANATERALAHVASGLVEPEVGDG